MPQPDGVYPPHPDGLIEGLTTETIVADRSGMDLFDVRPTPLDQAMRAALAEQGD